MNKSKLEALKKYILPSKPKHSHPHPHPHGDSDSQGSDSPLPERIDSDNDESETEKKQKILSKDEKMKRKFREALGVDQDEELDEFLNDQLVIENVEGVDLNALGRRGTKLTMERGLADGQYGDVHNVKLEEFINQNNVKVEMEEEKSEDSDIEVDRNASKQFKTVYRNKDGTIREESMAVKKERHQQQVYNTLEEWSKGMKQNQIKQENRNKKETFGNQDISDEYKIQLAQRDMFEDPMRVIKTTMGQTREEKKLFVCKYSGPGNRFNIAPGHRWDGVVRGNGFEWKYLKTKTEAQERHDEEMREYLQSL